jgi:hypothetical protein
VRKSATSDMPDFREMRTTIRWGLHLRGRHQQNAVSFPRKRQTSPSANADVIRSLDGCMFASPHKEKAAGALS